MISMFRYFKKPRAIQSMSVKELETEHENDNQEQLHGHKSGEHVGDFVFGGIDGVVTTFAVVAGVAGADLSASVILVLGLANLLADGFAMGIGNYLSIKSEKERYQHQLEEEIYEIEKIPEHERREIEEIYRGKGFEGKALAAAVETITSDKDRWVREMMFEEHGLTEDVRSPLRGGLVTYVAFIVIGLVPLLSFVLAIFMPGLRESTFGISVGLTILALFFIGALKTLVVRQSLFKAGMQTLLMGGLAAIVAYVVGYLLRGLA